MYTSLPHDDLIKCIVEVVKEAFEEQRASILKVHSSTTEWGNTGHSGHTNSSHQFTVKEVGELLAFVIRNTCLQNGDTVVRQILGIPMGTNAGTYIANLYLYYYESQFIDRLVDSGNLPLAQDFHMSFRMIDDLLCVDNARVREFVKRPVDEGGIYPKELVLESTTTSSTEVDFAGLTIKWNGLRYVTSVFDKRREFPFEVIMYPHVTSNMPRSVAYGVFVGQLHRFARACTLLSDLEVEIQGLLNIFLRKNFACRKLRQKLIQFTQNTVVSKYNTARWKLKKRWEDLPREVLSTFR
jgi:hypothetical protein